MSENQERLRANQDPLSQVALQKLKLVHENPDPNVLYLLQLAEWSLKEPESEKEKEFRELVQYLESEKNQDAVFQMLVYPENPGESVLSPEQAKDLSPEDLGRAVVDLVAEHLDSSEI